MPWLPQKAADILSEHYAAASWQILSPDRLHYALHLSNMPPDNASANIPATEILLNNHTAQ